VGGGGAVTNGALLFTRAPFSLLFRLERRRWRACGDCGLPPSPTETLFCTGRLMLEGVGGGASGDGERERTIPPVTPQDNEKLTVNNKTKKLVLGERGVKVIL